MISPQLNINREDCFKPDWCRKPSCLFINASPVCTSASLFDEQSKIVNRLYELSNIGKFKSTEHLLNKISRLYHLIYYLVLVEFQMSITSEDDVFKYITCEEIECFVSEFRCIGCDITCILDCFSILKPCGYGRRSENCEQCTSNFIWPGINEFIPEEQRGRQILTQQV